MNKKVVILGGGNGMSTLIRGLKQFPLDITAIVSVCDDGTSTGRLREEFKIPAVGDLRRVLISLAETEPLVEQLFNYRFETTSDLNGHTLGNLLLTAMTNITGNMSDGIESISKILNLRGRVVPLTEDNVILMGEMEDGTIIEGEHHITEDQRPIKKVYYKETPICNPDALKAVQEADLILLSMGSIYTSIIPNLLCKELVDQIDKSQAKIMYVCNIMTQNGETDHFKVSDHVKVLNEYLGKRKIDVIIANNGKIDESILNRYSMLEQKQVVILDKENVKDIEIIQEDLIVLEDNMLRHNVMRLAFNIFSYLL